MASRQLHDCILQQMNRTPRKFYQPRNVQNASHYYSIAGQSTIGVNRDFLKSRPGSGYPCTNLSGIWRRAPTCLESGDVQPRIWSVVTPPTVAVPHNQVETDGATKTYGCAVFGRPWKVVNGVPVPSQRGRGIQARLRATIDQWVWYSLTTGWQFANNKLMTW